MAKQISYEKALVIIRNLHMVSDTLKLDAFQKSTLLSVLFDIPKEKTIEHVRTGYI